MTSISSVTTSIGFGGAYVKDKAAIKAGAEKDGMLYRGEPVTAGFDDIIMPAPAVSVMLQLDDGALGVGDCCVSVFAGSGGRYGPIFQDEMVQLIEEHVEPVLVGRDLTSFRDLAERIEEINVDGRPIHPAIRYGVSQAILDAIADSERTLKAAILAREYDLSITDSPVNLMAQSGEQRHYNVDKMILKEVDMIPQGSFKSIGDDGAVLTEYVEWLVQRIDEIGTATYQPDIRLDVYGSIGDEFEDISAVADYLCSLEERLSPLRFIIEMPVTATDQTAQLRMFAELKDELTDRGSDVLLAIDEFANTYEDIELWAEEGAADLIQVKAIDVGGVHKILEAVDCINQNDVLAYLGGTANETDVSARTAVHIAMVANPYVMQCKPGLGVDEAVSIVTNEMNRILALT